MNILKIIKELYTGKNNLTAQLGIFSLISVMSISFNQIISMFTGNNLYAVFSVPSNTEAAIFAILGIMIFIYFTGYIYQFVHESFNQDNTELPSISLNCFTTFIKTFPVMFVWGLYIALIWYAECLLYSVNQIESILLFIFLLLLLPFVNMVFLLFAKDFKYDCKYFNPLIIVRLIKKTFFPVFLFMIQFLIIASIIIIINTYLFKYAINEHSRIVQLTLILLVLCISSYIQQILNLAYYKCLTDIIKKYYV